MKLQEWKKTKDKPNNKLFKNLNTGFKKNIVQTSYCYLKPYPELERILNAKNN